MKKKMSTEDYVERVTVVHEDKYDYSNVVYTGLMGKIEVACPKHGPFTIRASDHLYAKGRRGGCPICVWGGTPEERFFAKVNKNGQQVEYMNDPCWEWTAFIDKTGYGKFGTHDIVGLAHVFSYELVHGPIERMEDGRRRFWVLHMCDNRKCVNPSHLFLGNDKDNMQDAAKKGRLPCKLNPMKVKAIRGLYDTGAYTQEGLSEMFGVCQRTICQVVTGLTWQHVEE